ncbi:MAG: alpha/beta fold hydrolase [Elusimicrobiota bacterium]
MRRKAAFWLGIGAGAFFLASVAAFTLAPFETVTALRRAALWKNGVRRVPLEGGLFAYERNGCLPGKPCRCVALIHGLGDSALTWDKMLMDPRAGRAGLRLLAPDMPGADGSAPPADSSGWAIRAQARTLRTALESRCPEWTVAGNSLGGWTSLWLALDWPAGVHDLVLADAAGIEDPSGRQVESARVLAEPTLPLLKEFSRRARYRDREIPERAWISALASIKGRHTYELVHGLRREELLDSRLPGLRAPATIIWGDADGIIPIAVGARLHRLIKGSRYEVAKRCGHLPQQECPEVVARALFGVPPL